MRKKILVADDSDMNRLILSQMLSEEFDVLEVADGRDVLSVLEDPLIDISLLLLDVVMPGLDGFGVLEEMSKKSLFDSVPVLMISSENSPQYVRRAYELGATDYITRPFDANIVKRRVKNTLVLYAKQRRLEKLVEDQIREKQKNNNMMLSLLSNLVEFRNGESGLHVLHINAITEILLETVCKKNISYKMSKQEISLICMASSLHDIGKIVVPEHILNKRGKLTAEEYEIMKTHSAVGANIIKKIPAAKNDPLLSYAHEICRWHHERYDGRGYPDGLKGDEIPISAQVVSLADVYDALTSERVYKPPFPHEKAVQMIRNGECGAFSPFLLECLSDCESEIRKVIGTSSLHSVSDEKLSDITHEILNDDSTVASSGRVAAFLDNISKVNDEISELMGEIRFVYSKRSASLSISDWGARVLGCSEVILNPFANRVLLDLFGKSQLLAINRKIHNALKTNEKLVEKITFSIPSKGAVPCILLLAPHSHQFDKKLVYDGFVGSVRILNNNDEEKYDFK